MKPFLDIINLTIKVYNFEMSYEDYSRKVREDEYFYPMVIILAINLLAAFAILRIPWYGGIILIVAFISAMFAQKTAYTYKQQFFRGLIWAISNFLLSAAFLFLLVYMRIIWNIELIFTNILKYKSI